MRRLPAIRNRPGRHRPRRAALTRPTRGTHPWPQLLPQPTRVAAGQLCCRSTDRTPSDTDACQRTPGRSPSATPDTRHPQPTAHSRQWWLLSEGGDGSAGDERASALGGWVTIRPARTPGVCLTDGRDRAGAYGNAVAVQLPCEQRPFPGRIWNRPARTCTASSGTARRRARAASRSWTPAATCCAARVRHVFRRHPVIVSQRTFTPRGNASAVPGEMSAREGAGHVDDAGGSVPAAVVRSAVRGRGTSG